MADALQQILAMDPKQLAVDLSAAMQEGGTKTTVPVPKSSVDPVSSSGNEPLQAAWDGVVKPTYPENHVAAMRVPKGGSSCSSCEYLKDREKRLCGQEDYIKWNGGPEIPLPVDEFCSDWYEPEEKLDAAGTSEGASKGWDTRGRGRKEGSVSMMPGVRHVTEKDLDELRGWKSLARIMAHKLHDDSFSKEKSKAMASAGMLAKWLAGDFGEAGSFYALTTKNGMVGVMHVDSGAKTSHVHTLATRPDIIAGVTKERGVGTRLMIQAAKFAEAHGQGLDLTALDGAEGFYEKLGMHRVGVSPMDSFEWSPEEVKAFAGAVVHAGAELDDILKKIEEAMDAEDEFPPLASDRSPDEDELDASYDFLAKAIEELEAEALFNGVRITGFTGPEEEFVRAGLSRIPPELVQWVKEIRADHGMGAKHGNYDPATSVIRLNPNNFRLRLRFGRGPGWVLHAETTMCHEIGHSVYENLPTEMKQEWLKIGGWKKTASDTGDKLAPRYREKRAGWPTYNSKWRHKAGLLLPRTYASKSPDECFADCFSFFNLGKPQMMDAGIRKFLQKVVERVVRKYPRALVEGPTKSYVYERTKSGNSAGSQSTSEPEG